MAAKSDYYTILGVSKSASAEELKKAYRKQALEWHPDRHKDNKEEAEKRFKEINEAYQILSDSQKRSAYDQYGHDAFSPGGMPGGFGGTTGPFTYTYTSTDGDSGNPFGNFDFGDPFEIFEQFFGGSPFRQAKRVPRYSLSLDFIEAIKGTEKEVSIEGKRRKIKIPAGVDEGSRIDFGDFTLSIKVKSHNLFERDGEDIYVKVSLPYSIAVLGGNFGVPTIDGEVEIRVRPGTVPGTTVRLRGKGVPNLHGRGRGDEYVRLNISVPEKLSGYQREIVEELKKEGL